MIRLRNRFYGMSKGYTPFFGHKSSVCLICEAGTF